MLKRCAGCASPGHTVKRTAPEARESSLPLALAQGEMDFSSEKKGQRKIRDRLRGNKAELSWLMRTSYISNETESRRHQAAPKARQSEAAEPSLDADEAHYLAAEVMLPR